MADKSPEQIRSQKRPRDITQKGTIPKIKSKATAKDDDLSLKDMKNELRKVTRDRSEKDKSKTKTSESGGRVENVEGEEDSREENVKMWFEVDNSVLKESHSRDGVNVVEEREVGKEEMMKVEDEEYISTPKPKRGADKEMIEAYVSSLCKPSCRLRPRKTPVFRMVELEEDDYNRIVGKKVKVYCSGSRKWFTGRIEAFDKDQELHQVLYDDGEREWLDLDNELVEIEVLPSADFKLKTESSSRTKPRKLDGGKSSVDEMNEESDKAGGIEKETKNHKPEKRKAGKKAGSRLNWKSQRRGSEVEKAQDLITEAGLKECHEGNDGVIADEVSDVKEPEEASSEKGHKKSKPFSEIAAKGIEKFEAQVAEMEAQSEVRKMGSDSCIEKESQHTLADESTDVPITQFVKTYVRLKKKGTRTTAEKSSKSESVPHDKVKMYTIDVDKEVNEAAQIKYQKGTDNLHALAERMHGRCELSDRS